MESHQTDGSTEGLSARTVTAGGMTMMSSEVEALRCEGDRASSETIASRRRGEPTLGLYRAAFSMRCALVCSRTALDPDAMGGAWPGFRPSRRDLGMMTLRFVKHGSCVAATTNSCSGTRACTSLQRTTQPMPTSAGRGSAMEKYL
jgi:hypothetical protein